jgi:replicative DNA helicase
MDPIWNEDAEKAIIGSAIRNPKILEKMGGLYPDHFYHPKYGYIWGVIQELSAQMAPIDELTIGEAAGHKVNDVAEVLSGILSATPTASNYGRYADIVRDKATRRALFEVGLKAMELAQGTETTSAAMESISNDLSALHTTQIKKVPRSLYEIMLTRTEYYDDLKEGRVASGWGCSLPSLNRALSGGFRPGKLYFIGARPGVGKSSLSAQIMIDLAKQGHGGLFLSQEMAVEEVGDRTIANCGHIEMSKIITGDLHDEDWTRASEAIEMARGLPVWIDDQPSLTLSDIRHKARSVPGIKLLVLDYLQLCLKNKGSSAGNRNSEIEEISRGLKALAMDMGISIIALSQLNREVDKRPDKKPQMSDLRDSGSIEADADGIFFLWPVRDLDAGGMLVGLSIAKNRQGRPGGEIALDFRGATQRWGESTESLSQSQQSQQDQPRSKYGYGGK